MIAAPASEPPPSRARRALRGAAALLAGGSGPAVARAYHRALAALFVVAWLSLASQVELLIGSRGLLPLAPLLAQARASGGLAVRDFPTLFWLADGDAVLRAGTWLGGALAAGALAGLRPRLLLAASAILYASYVVACRDFLSFQWDNLLLESALLAAFLPRDRPSRVAHLLVRLLLFKLYFESGLAKWQSPTGDWLDGSAMNVYYETSPLPTALAWYAHHLPAGWHHFESIAVLVLELGVPWLFFGPRRARLAAAAAVTAFQAVNLATSNYGQFVYLALALHLFLLDDADVRRATGVFAGVWTRRQRRRRPPSPSLVATRSRIATVFGIAGAALWLLLSAVDGLSYFAHADQRVPALASVRRLYYPFHAVSSYHLFTTITRTRIEPELQTFDGETWTAHDFHHKPGDVGRRPDFVAPHQPRVDFLLWFYGLHFRHRTDAYVRNLLQRVCDDPAAVQDLFPAPLPDHPVAVRFVFYDYRFTSSAERNATGAWWRRTQVAAGRPLPCQPPAGALQ